MSFWEGLGVENLLKIIENCFPMQKGRRLENNVNDNKKSRFFYNPEVDFPLIFGKELKKNSDVV